jgi:alpha-beta hydrolase superfamily lysophospholipase
VTATPFWFGSAERPLFGWFHAPTDQPVVGGIVLCPPLGIEAICAYFSYRFLADRLAERGLVALRFDYDGTGDSTGDEEDPGRLDAWLGSVRCALDFLAASGVPRLGLLGMRVGALLAADEAARRGDVDSMVLWDPCLNGRSFLREQQALRMLSLGGADGAEGAVDAPGLRFHPETVRDLTALELPRTSGRLASRTLVLTHPERPWSSRLAQRLEGETVEWMEATGQGELLDPPLQEPPYQTIEGVTDWLSGALKGPAVSVVPPESAPATVARSCGGEAIVERPVSLGPLPLFGIVTEIPDQVAGPTVVFVDEGNTPHIGQSRMWVELARALAAEGLRVLRFDLSANGDSGARPGQPWHIGWAIDAFQDLADARRAISAEDPANVVLVGLCSGAYQSIEEGLGAPPRAICAVNPIMTFPLVDRPLGDGTRRRARQATKTWVIRATRTPVTWMCRRWAKDDTDRWLEAFEIGRWPAAIARRVRVPAPVWWLVNRCLLENQTVEVLEKLVDAGVDTLLLCGPDDLQPIELGERRSMQRLEQTGLFRSVLLPELDHAGLLIEPRRALKRALTEHIVSRYAPGAPTRGAVGLESSPILSHT